MNEGTQTVRTVPATIVERVMATLVDFLIMLGFLVVVYLIPIVLQIINASVNSNALRITVIVLWIIFSVVAFAGIIYYFFIWPVKHNGQTIGKKFQKIRIMVVKDLSRGSVRPMTKGDFSINFNRTITLIIDYFFFGLVGIFLINDDVNNRRFGDKIAGTVVVSEKND
jgi:uncharacterized RDD family membrane protein YckC